MKAIFELDSNYNETKFIDFNKKRYLIAFNLFIVLFSFLIFYRFRINMCPPFTIRGIILFVIGIFSLIIIHELIHGLFIRLISKKKANYKFSFFYASASAADRYFDKSSYIVIALAPVIIISIFLFYLLNISNTEYYNSLLLLFALTFSGGIGDIYITVVTLFQPKETFILDEGEAMRFFTKTT